MTERDKWPDDVRRVKDHIDLHAIARREQGDTGPLPFLAFALADGAPLGGTYDTWNDAVKAARWDRDNYMFPQLRPDGIPYREAAAILEYARGIHKMGHRIPDPDWQDHEATQMPRTRHDRRLAARQLKTGRPLYDPSVTYSNLPHFLRRQP